MSTIGIPEQMDASGFVSGSVPAIRKVNSLSAEVARTDIPILLVGESGTGKEVYARAIHRLSGRGEGPLRKISCSTRDVGGILEDLLQEFRSAREGKQITCGTVFLDGVHDLGGAEQRVLLSLLRDGEQNEGLGQIRPRIVSSTTRNLEREAAAGRFLSEVYFRLGGAILYLPPLRDRKEDIPALTQYFLMKYAGELKKDAPELDEQTLELLSSHNWPGNIRELENTVKKMVAFGDPMLALGDLQSNQSKTDTKDEGNGVSPLKAASRAASLKAERAMIQKALEKTHWNRKRAAKDLQISYKSLLYKIKQAGLDGNEI